MLKQWRWQVKFVVDLYKNVAKACLDTYFMLWVTPRQRA